MLSLASAAVTACPTEMGSFMPGPRPRSPPRHRHHMLVKKSQNSFKEIVCYTCIACDITSCRVHYRTSLLTPLDSSNITDVPWAMDTGNKIFIGLCPMWVSQASSSCSVQDEASLLSAGVGLVPGRLSLKMAYSSNSYPASHFKSVTQTYITRLDFFFLPFFLLCFSGGEEKKKSSHR